MQIPRGSVAPESLPVPTGIVRAFDMSSGHAPLFGLSVQPDIALDALSLTVAQKGGWDLCGNRVEWTVNSGISIVEDAGFGSRPVVNFTTKGTDLRVYAPTTKKRTILAVASFAASEIINSHHSNLVTVLDVVNDDGLNFWWDLFGAPITTNGGLQFSPDVTGGITGVNMDGASLPAADTAAVFAVTFQGDSGSANFKQSKQYINSTTAQTTFTHSGAGPAPSTEAAWFIGSEPLLIQASSGNWRGWLGKVACVWGFPDVLSTADLGAAITTLKARYGIS